MPAAPPPRLTALIRAVTTRPPALQDLLRITDNAEDHKWFQGLVRLLFPRQAEQLLSQPGEAERVRNFTQQFGNTFFPLSEEYIEFYVLDTDGDPQQSPYSILRRGIPYELFGTSSEAIHEMWRIYSPSLASMHLFADFAGYIWDPGDVRVAWLEEAAAHIPQPVLERLPKDGVSTPRLTLALKDTRFEAVAHAAQCVSAQTGNFFLDCNYEDGGYEGYADPWDEDWIQQATNEWNNARPILDSINNLAGWLQEDLPARFEEMLDFVLERLSNTPEPQEPPTDD